MEKLLHQLNQNLVIHDASSDTDIYLEDEIIPETSKFPPAAEALDVEKEAEVHEQPLVQENDWSD